MDMEPNGCLPLKVLPRPDDRLIFAPVFILPVESLERGLFSRPKYIFETVLVDGCSGSVNLSSDRDLIVDYDYVPGDGQKEYLKIKVSPEFAQEAARFGALPEDCRSWHSLVKQRHVFVRAEGMKLAWRVYIIRDQEVIDTFSGRRSDNAEMVGMLFGR